MHAQCGSACGAHLTTDTTFSIAAWQSSDTELMASMIPSPIDGRGFLSGELVRPASSSKAIDWEATSSILATCVTLFVWIGNRLQLHDDWITLLQTVQKFAIQLAALW